ALAHGLAPWVWGGDLSDENPVRPGRSGIERGWTYPANPCVCAQRHMQQHMQQHIEREWVWVFVFIAMKRYVPDCAPCK
ncbi:MAG TPA: hypothetical protein PK216_14060, partial [Aquimonas sp.]|nr:hypothetical protein [Aquimonas sp.]